MENLKSNKITNFANMSETAIKEAEAVNKIIEATESGNIEWTTTNDYYKTCYKGFFLYVTINKGMARRLYISEHPSVDSILSGVTLTVGANNLYEAIVQQLSDEYMSRREAFLDKLLSE